MLLTLEARFGKCVQLSKVVTHTEMGTYVAELIIVYVLRFYCVFVVKKDEMVKRGNLFRTQLWCLCRDWQGTSFESGCQFVPPDGLKLYLECVLCVHFIDNLANWAKLAQCTKRTDPCIPVIHGKV